MNGTRGKRARSMATFPSLFGASCSIASIGTALEAASNSRCSSQVGDMSMGIQTDFMRAQRR